MRSRSLVLSFSTLILSSLQAGNYTANSYSSLSTAITNANANPGSTISITESFSFTGTLPNITASTTIQGNSNTLNGTSAHPGFAVQSGSATIENLTLENMLRTGGAGGPNNYGTGPGGAAGTGGGLFVVSGASATLQNVVFNQCGAQGGNGGEGNTGYASFFGGSGGGGLGFPGIVGSFTADGGDGGNSIDGTGGGAGGTSVMPMGGMGGFGGGGGGSYDDDVTYEPGGMGGFGGGAGGCPGQYPGTGAGSNGGYGGGGSGGYGPGPGNSGGSGGTFGGNGGDGAFNGTFGVGAGGGGGGSAFGGAIFVQNGGTLVMQDGDFSGSTLTGGSGGTAPLASPGTNGMPGIGKDLFLMSGATATLTVTSGTITLPNPIASDQGVGGGSGGGLNTSGSGTLVLTGANTYTGTTTVQQGTLLLASGSTIITNVTVNAGATLGGLGSVGTTSNSVTNNGTISPGASSGAIGTFTITDNCTFNAGSTYQIDINGSGASDLLVVGATATISPSNTTVLVTPQSGMYTSGTTYTIMSATNPFVGQFAHLVFPVPRFTGTLVYDPPPNQLLLILDLVPFGVLVPTGDAHAIAKCFDTLTGSGDLIILTLLLNSFTSPEAFNSAFSQMSPSVFGNMFLIQEDNGLAVRTAITHRTQNLYINDCGRLNDRAWTIWAEPFGYRSGQKNNNCSQGYQTTSGGAVVGADYEFFDHFYGGLGGAYTNSNVKWNRGSGGTINSYYGFLYGSWFNNWAYADASISGASNHYDAKRKISFSYISRSPHHNSHGWELGGHLGAGYLGHAGQFQLQPFARADYIHLHQDGFKEQGAGVLNLQVYSQNGNLFRAEVGLAVSRCYTIRRGMVAPEAYLSYVRQDRFKDSKVAASFEGSSCKFKTCSFSPNRNLIAPGLGISLLYDNGFSFDLRYDGEIGKNFWNHELSANLGVSW